MPNLCNACDQMKKENAQLRKNRDEIYKNYVELANENLELRRQMEANAARFYLSQGA